MNEDLKNSEQRFKDFAKQHRLRVKRDECGDLNIIGNRGDIYDYSDGIHYCVTILHCPNAHHWNRYEAIFRRLGYRITQNGDEEGTALFDPANAEQTEAALKAIRAFRRRVLTPEQKSKLLAVQHRFQPRKTHSEGKSTPESTGLANAVLKPFSAIL